jgi:hypothetical protein
MSAQVGYYEYHLVRQLEHRQRGNQQIFDRTVRRT